MFWPGLGYVQVVTIAVAVLLVTVGFLGYRLYQTNVRYTRLAPWRVNALHKPS